MYICMYICMLYVFMYIMYRCVDFFINVQMYVETIL